MDLSIIVMAVGLVIVILSFFVGRSKTDDHELEELSVTLYKETSQIKRRLKVVEEELMLEAPAASATAQKTTSLQGVHQILVSQVLALHKQGYNIAQIAERSSLSPVQIEQIIHTGGKLS